MDTTTNETANSLTGTLRQLGPARLGIMAAVVLGLLVFFVFISMRVSSPDLKLLYADLSTESSGAVATKLEESAITYEVSPDGSRVMVPEKDVGRARMLLAQAGLPDGGHMGYEIFDKESGFGTTNFVQNVKQVRALEGELARTVTSIDTVKSARVHLVLPQRELFSRENRPASASVFLELKGAGRLSDEQVIGIQSLISSAVPDLKITNVSIIDSKGNLLAKGGADGDTLTSLKTEELKRETEQRMTESVENLIGRTVGFDKVRANVSVDLNFDRITTTDEIYDPEKQVVRSTQTVEENAAEKEAGADNVSVENNLPAAEGDMLQDGGTASNSNRVEETTNYEISKTIRNQVREGGEVKRLSVAVLVDGTYTTDKEGVKTYSPRSQKDLDQIATLVKSSIGFDEARGDTVEVVNMQFAEIDVSGDVKDDTIMGFEKADLLDAAEVISIAVMMILVLLLVIQPMVTKLLDTAPAGGGGRRGGPGGIRDAEQAFDMLPGPAGHPALTGPQIAGQLEGPSMGGAGGGIEDNTMIDMQRVEGQVKASTLKKVEEIVSAYPSETVSVLRNWMSTKD